jgi:hypothetical protein
MKGERLKTPSSRRRMAVTVKSRKRRVSNDEIDEEVD